MAKKTKTKKVETEQKKDLKVGDEVINRNGTVLIIVSIKGNTAKVRPPGVFKTGFDYVSSLRLKDVDE